MAAAVEHSIDFIHTVEWPDSHPDLPDIARAQFTSIASNQQTDDICSPTQISDEELLRWCLGHEHLRVISADVTGLFCGGSPDSASELARRFRAGDIQGVEPVVFIHDVKVSPSRAKGSGYKGFAAMTDDRVYADHALVRERIPRGLAFLQVCQASDLNETFQMEDGKGGERVQVSRGWSPAAGVGEISCLIRGLRKFTGRDHGDDDDTLPTPGQGAEAAKEEEWRRFFTADPAATTHVAAMEKANGESGHFTVINTPSSLKAAIGSSAPDHMYVGGSKTVHIVARTHADLQHPVYASSRYAFARGIIASCIDTVEHSPLVVQQQFAHFMADLRITMCVEYLNPATQHVERFDFSHPVPQALTFVSSRPSQPAGLTLGMHPIVAAKVATYFGFDVVAHSLHPMSEHAQVLQRTRYLYGKEGYVLYYIDAAGAVIGLVKRKSVWYIIQRAVREKARSLARRLTNLYEAQRLLASTISTGTSKEVLARAAALQKLVDGAVTKCSRPANRIAEMLTKAQSAPASISAATILAGSYQQDGQVMHSALLPFSSPASLQVRTALGSEAGTAATGGRRSRRKPQRTHSASSSSVPVAIGGSSLVVADCGAACTRHALQLETRAAACLTALRLHDIQLWLSLHPDTVAAYAGVILPFILAIGACGHSEYRHLHTEESSTSAAAAVEASAGTSTGQQTEQIASQGCVQLSNSLVPTEVQAQSAALRVQTWMQNGWAGDLLGNRFPQMMSVFLEQRGINDNIDPL
jgi:hypothetical protein